MPEIEKCPCAGCRDKREVRLRTELASLTEDKRILSGQLFDCRKERKMALDRELSVRTELAYQAASKWNDAIEVAADKSAQTCQAIVSNIGYFFEVALRIAKDPTIKSPGDESAALSEAEELALKLPHEIRKLKMANEVSADCPLITELSLAWNAMVVRGIRDGRMEAAVLGVENSGFAYQAAKIEAVRAEGFRAGIEASIRLLTAALES